jgi:hypothetical protein
MDLKQALIKEILRSKNNVYSEIELQNIRISYIQQIHDELILSGGKPIKKMDLKKISEIDFD